ncbi:retrovirus-related pol polyprotein from transposon TNT 1-94 [Tanacetum coccineum]
MTNVFNKAHSTVRRPINKYTSPKCPTFNGRPTFANPVYLKKAQYEHLGLYAITQDQSDPATRLIPDSEEILTLADKSRSKLNKDLVKPFDYTKLNMSKSVSKSRQAYNVMTNNINHLNELVNQAWVKHSNDHLYLRHPTAQDMEILVKKCLMPLALKTQNDSLAFIHELKQEMHADLKYVESLEDELDELESDKAEFSNMYDMLLQECVSKDVMCSYLLTSSDLDEITELQCLYLHKVMECDCLAQKLYEQTDFVSKEIYTELLQRFARLEKLEKTQSISLEIAFNKNGQEQINRRNDISFARKMRQLPISTRKPKSQANKSVATPHKKTVASESTITSSKSYYRMLYKKTSKAWKWWIAQQCPSTYKWVPKTQKKWVPKTQKEMGNDQFAPNLGYEIWFKETYDQKDFLLRRSPHHNLFSSRQLPGCIFGGAFQKSTCFVRDLQGNDLLSGNHGSDLYTISLQETTSSTPICLLAKASPTQAWLWHRRLFLSQLRLHQLAFKERYCDWFTKTERHEFLNKTLNAFFTEEGNEHQTSTPRTPEQNGVVERRNRTLVEASRTMLSASKLPLFFWAEAIQLLCYTQNRS